MADEREERGAGSGGRGNEWVTAEQRARCVLQMTCERSALATAEITLRAVRTIARPPLTERSLSVCLCVCVCDTGDGRRTRTDTVTVDDLTRPSCERRRTTLMGVTDYL